MKYTTTLKDKREVAEGTMEFTLQKPEGFVFKAGQYMDVTLIKPSETDEEGNTRTFSITAAPHEDHISFATRMRDTAFKRVIKAMNSGTELTVDGPMGSFTLHQNVARPAVFLVGGIGITPFMSILKDATERKLEHKLYLFYSNRRPEDTAFFTELKELAQKNQNIVFIPTMTDMEKSAEKWEGETGYINKDMIEKYVKEASAIYYTAGPEAMVGAMRKILAEMQVSDDDIKTEEFAGY